MEAVTVSIVSEDVDLGGRAIKLPNPKKTPYIAHKRKPFFGIGTFAVSFLSCPKRSLSTFAYSRAICTCLGP